MKHLGDITKLDGAEIPVVDVITGGSPCQDLSVAGLRKGLKHEENGDEETTRSGLFMDQLRIVKEMRANDKRNGRSGIHVRPRFMVWENVPGALSSPGKKDKGKDFQAVLTEIARVVEPDAPDVPMPEGGWPNSGCIYGEMGDWSVAYRIHDAQYWGVPQRRRRIALVADFNGLAAPEILFDSQLRGEDPDSEPDEAVRGAGEQRASELQPFGDGLQRNPDAGEPQREETAGCSGNNAGATEAVSFQERAGKPGGAKESSCKVNEPEQSQPQTPSECLPDAFSSQGNTIDRAANQNGGGISKNQSHTLNSVDRHAVCAVDCRNGTENPFVNGTLQAKEQGMNLNSNNVVRVPMP